MWSVSNNIFHRRQRKSGDEPCAEKCEIISFSVFIDFHLRYSSSTFFFKLNRLSWGTLFCLKNTWNQAGFAVTEPRIKHCNRQTCAWLNILRVPTSLHNTNLQGRAVASPWHDSDSFVTNKATWQITTRKKGFSNFLKLFYFLIFKRSYFRWQYVGPNLALEYSRVS